MTIFAAGCSKSENSSKIPWGTGFDKSTLFDIYEPDRPEYDFNYESKYEIPEAPKAKKRWHPQTDPAYASSVATTKSS